MNVNYPLTCDIRLIGSYLIKKIIPIQGKVICIDNFLIAKHYKKKLINFVSNQKFSTSEIEISNIIKRNYTRYRLNY